MIRIPIAGVGIVTLHPSTPRPVDGLCPTCWLPTLVTVDLMTFTPHGVTTVGAWTGCLSHHPGDA